MKYYTLIVLCAFAVFSGCVKDDKPDQAEPPRVDTLSAGWSKVAALNNQAIDIFFKNDKGFIITPTKIFRSNDAGATWNEVFTRYGALLNIAMGSSMNAVFLSAHTSRDNKVISTRDGGNSFDSVELANDFLRDAYFVNATTVYGIGEKFWKSTDAGRTWVALPFQFSPDPVIRHIYFLSELVGWVSVGSSFYKTTDGGQTWQEIVTAVNGPEKIRNFFFSDSQNGMLASEKSLLGTRNGGATWQILLPLDNNFYDVHMISPLVTYVIRENTVLKTADGGATWAKVLALDRSYMLELHFTDADHGWVASGSGDVFRFVH